MGYPVDAGPSIMEIVSLGGVDVTKLATAASIDVLLGSSGWFAVFSSAASPSWAWFAASWKLIPMYATQPTVSWHPFTIPWFPLSPVAPATFGHATLVP